MATMATGMAFGAGSEIAHQGVRAMLGGGSGHSAEPQQQAAPQQQQVQQQMPPMENPCARFNSNLISCLQQNRGDVAICQSYMDMLSQCERDQSHYNRF